MKQLIPFVLRLNVKLLRRIVKDKRSSIVFAKKKEATADFPFSISEKQPIKQSSYYQNKIDNIQLGARFIQEVVIEANETISFWKVIGKPSQKRGFKIGRNLIAGKLTADYGGGLCQLSGILYITSLKGGLDIKERHNHTVDIYKEEERFTPLGSDATVVYAYKDLRVRNPYAFPIRFTFEVDSNSLECKLISREVIEAASLEFVRKTVDNRIDVETIRNGISIGISSYIKPKS